MKQPHAQDFSLKNGSGGKSPGYQVALNAVEDVPPVYPWELEEFDSSEYFSFYHIHFSLVSIFSNIMRTFPVIINSQRLLT